MPTHWLTTRLQLRSTELLVGPRSSAESRSYPARCRGWGSVRQRLRWRVTCADFRQWGWRGVHASPLSTALQNARSRRGPVTRQCARLRSIKIGRCFVGHLVKIGATLCFVDFLSSTYRALLWDQLIVAWLHVACFAVCVFSLSEINKLCIGFWNIFCKYWLSVCTPQPFSLEFWNMAVGACVKNPPFQSCLNSFAYTYKNTRYIKSHITIHLAKYVQK